MDADLNHLLTLVSLAGAVLSGAGTAWFWLVRSRGERPQLACELAGHEFYLGDGRQESRMLGLRLKLIVANDSTLPNAVLGARGWVALADGGWQELAPLAFDCDTPRPVNMPPLQTALVTVNGYLTFPAGEETERRTAHETLKAYADRHLADPRWVRVELRGMKDRSFAATLRWGA